MYARRKPKKGAVGSRVKKMYDEAATKGEKQYQSDLSNAHEREAGFKKLQQQKQVVQDNRESVANAQSASYRRAGVNASPSKDVQTRKSSGMYDGSVPVAGTSDKKLYAKRNPIKGVRRSDAKGSVKRSMIRKMKSSSY
jgi:hypothetical protein